MQGARGVEEEEEEEEEGNESDTVREREQS